MVQDKYLAKRLIRIALYGTFALTLVIIGAKLIENITATTDAQGISVKDDQVTADAATKAAPPAESEPVNEKPLITAYTVQKGDTLTGIAKHFSISINTIRWANDLNSKSQIKVGDELVILPFSGIQYTVKKGDTLSGIVVKFGGDQNEILSINGIDDPKKIKPGMKLMIPDGEMHDAPAAASAQKTTTKTSSSTKTTTTSSEPSETHKEKSGTYVHPIPGSVLTQGLHAFGAVDFGAPIGTSVHAVAHGTVIIAKNSGNNGGFGKYVVITHDNGVQTLYAHLSSVEVTPGESVDQGQEIAKSGSTGKSTGPHLHIEFHGASNPWAHDKKGTHY
jgi:murein DD-endopeptidase MepM/ murein hydrolase activator NlpD